MTTVHGDGNGVAGIYFGRQHDYYEQRQLTVIIRFGLLLATIVIDRMMQDNRVSGLVRYARY